MQNFIAKLKTLSKHPNRNIKGYSIHFLKHLQEITEYLENNQNIK